jgi:hypothetical protein
MAAAAMEVAQGANQEKVALKAVEMDVARAVKAAVRDVVAVVAVDAEAMVEIAKAARNANASTPKANPCSQMPICREQPLAHKNPPARSNALIVVRAPSVESARSVETDQAAAASETKVVNVTNHVQKPLP